MYFGVYLLLAANFCHVCLAAHVLETEDWSSCSEQHGDQISPSAASYANKLHWAVMMSLLTDRESYLSSFICESFRWFCSLSFANCCLLSCSCWLRKWHFSPTALHYSTNKWLILYVVSQSHPQLDPLPLSYSLCWGLLSTIKLKLIIWRGDKGLAGQTISSLTSLSSFLVCCWYSVTSCWREISCCILAWLKWSFWAHSPFSFSTCCLNS